MTHVRTKLHRLQAEGYATGVEVQAHYVVQDDVVDAVYNNGHRLAKAASQMYAAGRLALPFESVLVEADLGTRAAGAMLPARAMRALVWLRRATPPAVAVARIYGFATMAGRDVAFQEAQEVETTGALEDLHSMEQGADRMPRSIAANAFLFAALMANTRGIEKVRVEHDKLNKKRKTKGVPPVPAYTVVRIGTVYSGSNDGEAVEHHRHMPVHWRAGHWRSQRYGTKWSKCRDVFIEAVLVNSEDGTEPLVRPKHVRV
jgi:hypothetical protein